MEAYIIFCMLMINISLGSIISPTTINATTENYISSDSPQSFSSNDIICRSSTCIVTCNTDSGCDHTIINASMSNNLLLNCLNYRSCYYINVTGPVHSTQINCIGINSCNFANLRLDHTQNIDMLCNGTDPCFVSGCNSDNVVCRNMIFKADYSTNVNIDCGISTFECAYSQFNIEHAGSATIRGASFYMTGGEIIGTNMTNKLTVRCDKDCSAHIYCPDNALCDIFCGTSCKYSTISKNMDTINKLNLTCMTQSSCVDLKFVCTDTGKDSIITLDDEYKCSNDDCCPFKYNRPIIYCPQNVANCVITCSDYAEGCEFKSVDIMNGSNVTSLTINCDYWYYCQGARIHIIKPIESFTLNCPYLRSCRYISIDLNVTKSVSLSCIGSSSGDACKASDINIKGTSNTNIEIITSQHAFRGSDLNFISGNQFNLSCVSTGCDTTNFLAKNMNSINIDCGAQDSCKYSNFIVDANDIVLICEGWTSCYNSYWKVQATMMRIRCDAFSQDRSCNNMDIDADIVNSLIITSNSQHAFEPYFGSSNFNVSCLDCINVQKCGYPTTPNMTFYCGVVGTENSNGDQCNNCVCNGKDQVFTDNIWTQCLPTPEPTKNPTVNPTLEPTLQPTFDPTLQPTLNPTQNPTEPTKTPTKYPTEYPTSDPTDDPTIDPTSDPTDDPTIDPTSVPTKYPTTFYPTNIPITLYPTALPSNIPTTLPSSLPSTDPTRDPTMAPTAKPTIFIIMRTPPPSRAKEDSVSGESDISLVMIIVMIVVAVAVLVLFLYGIFWCRKRQIENNKNVVVMQENQQQILYVVPAQQYYNQPVNQIEMQSNANNDNMVQPPKNNEGDSMKMTVEGPQGDENITYQ